MPTLDELLRRFADESDMRGKGPLCVALVVTRIAKDNGLPLDPDKLLAKSGGQVAGLGKGSVQKILVEYGISRVLAEEGGRTSRGSVGNMRAYVAFLNAIELHTAAVLDEIERWWVERVREYFGAQPLILRVDQSKSLRFLVRDLLSQAERRQKEDIGTMFLGAVLQHLVGAKLEILIEGGIAHHGASVADQASGYEADFLIADVALHVTTSPGEALLRKCERNLSRGLRPVIVTTLDGSTAASVHAKAIDIQDRVDVFEAEQFLAGNLYELGRFTAGGRQTTAENLISRYNAIVAQHETDPSLRIEIGE